MCLVGKDFKDSERNRICLDQRVCCFARAFC